MILPFAVALATGIFLATFPESPMAAGNSGGYARARYVLPRTVLDKGCVFADTRIPLDRREVSERVADQVNYLLMDRRSGLMEWFDRMAIYGPMMMEVLRQEKIPADLIYLSALVSDLHATATTRSGGVGWWGLGSVKQKKNSTASPWVVTSDWDDRRDPVESTRLASASFHLILKGYPQPDWLLAICSFVDGSEAVDAVVSKAQGFSYWDMVMPHYSEVIIPRLVALKIIDTHRKFYGVDVPPVSALQCDSLGRVKLAKDLPLYVAAKWCGTIPRAIWEINPGVDPSTGLLPKADNRNPSGYPLRVPKGMAAKVRALLTKEGYMDK